MLVVSSLSSVADGCSSGNLVLLVQIYKNIISGKVEMTNQDLYKVLHHSAHSFWFLAPNHPG
jgi:hypothetical protein